MDQEERGSKQNRSVLYEGREKKTDLGKYLSGGRQNAAVANEAGLQEHKPKLEQKSTAPRGIKIPNPRKEQDENVRLNMQVAPGKVRPREKEQL